MNPAARAEQVGGFSPNSQESLTDVSPGRRSTGLTAGPTKAVPPMPRASTAPPASCPRRRRRGEHPVPPRHRAAPRRDGGRRGGDRAARRSTRPRTSAPTCVLLDVMLPDLDGFEVCRRMRSDGVGRAGHLPHRPRRHRGQGARPQPRRRRLRDQAVLPRGAPRPRARSRCAAPASATPSLSRLEFADLEMDEDAHRVVAGRHAGRAVADGVQAAALLPAEPRPGAQPGPDPRPRVGVRLRRCGQRGRRPTSATCARSSTRWASRCSTPCAAWATCSGRTDRVPAAPPPARLRRHRPGAGRGRRRHHPHRRRLPATARSTTGCRNSRRPGRSGRSPRTRSRSRGQEPALQRALHRRAGTHRPARSR